MSSENLEVQQLCAVCSVILQPFDWLPVIKKASGLLSQSFEKQAHANHKYASSGGDNFYSVMFGRRSLRFTAEQVSTSLLTLNKHVIT